MERRKAERSAMCARCRKSIRRGCWVVVKGGSYLHASCAEASVPDPEKPRPGEESAPVKWAGPSRPQYRGKGVDVGKVRCRLCDMDVRVRKNGTLYVHGDARLDGADCPMSGAPEEIATALSCSVCNAVFDLPSTDPVPPHGPRPGEVCGEESAPGQDCPACGHWVYGDACTQDGCGWRAERPRMTMRQILDGVRTRGDLAHLSPVDAYETAHGVRPVAVSERASTVRVMDEKKPDPFETPSTVTPPEPETNVSGQPEPLRDQWGRYLLPHPETGLYSDGKPKSGRRNGWTRVTTFAKAAADTFALTRYDERLTLVGATLRPDVVALAHGKQVREDAKDLNQLVLQVKEAAGAKVAANHGTAVHQFTERVDAGQMRVEDVPDAYRDTVRAYVECLRENGLEPVPGLIERTTFVDGWKGVAGTLDRVLYHRPTDTYVIGDVKTGRDLSYGRMEIAVQMALYAHGVNHHGVYDWLRGEWQAPAGSYGDGPTVRVRTDFGVVMHLPIQGDAAGTCTLKRVKLAAGWDAAQVCGDVLASRKRDDYMEDGFDLAYTPYVPETPPEPNPEGPGVVTWAQQFSRVASKAEASALWQDAKSAGVDRMELQRLVSLAQQRLREIGVPG